MPVVATPITAPAAELRTESEIFESARLSVGNVPSGVAGDLSVKDEALRAAMRPVVRELNRLFGTANSKKEVVFETLADTQDYPVATYVSASDVGEILEVSRSGMFVSDGSLRPNYDLDVNGRVVGTGVIPDGYQGAAMDVIRNIERARHLDRYDWELAYNSSGGEVIRLYPVPSAAGEIVHVTYTTTGASIETLPDEAEDALHYAACVALLDGMINRLNALPTQMSESKEAASTQLRALTQQRDRYEGKFEAAKNRASR